MGDNILYFPAGTSSLGAPPPFVASSIEKERPLMDRFVSRAIQVLEAHIMCADGSFTQKRNQRMWASSMTICDSFAQPKGNIGEG